MQLRPFILSIALIAMSILSHAQDQLRVGMTADEFRSIRPGILPDEPSYSGSIGLADTIGGIPGTWSLTVGKNHLVSAQFHWKEVKMDEEAYNLWRDRIVAVCNLAQQVWGPPIEANEGKMAFHPWDDRRPEGLAHGSREVFQDMKWEMGRDRIAIYSGFSSNHYPLDMHGQLANSPPEMFSYGFSIIYDHIPDAAPLDRMELSAPVPSPEEEHSIPKASEFTPANVRLGMSLNELKAAFPRISAVGSSMTGQFHEEGELKGLQGSWTYNFEKGSLRHWGFSHYERKISEDNFNKCLAAADAQVADQTKLIGKPESLVRENTQYIDPSKKHHWGYKVLNAKWIKPEGATTEVRFQFFGGKGDYFFLFELKQDQI